MTLRASGGKSLVVVAAMSGAAIVWLATRQTGGSQALAPSPVPATEVDASRRSLAVDARGERSLPPEFARRYPPGTTVRFAESFAPADFTAGIACPGGGFLPLMNGVPFAEPLQRNLERDGPVPPVVGKHTDADGDEWHVHADGSETTTRWTTISVSGSAQRRVRTDHAVPARTEHGLAPGHSSRDR